MFLLTAFCLLSSGPQSPLTPALDSAIAIAQSVRLWTLDFGAWPLGFEATVRPSAGMRPPASAAARPPVRFGPIVAALSLRPLGGATGKGLT